MILNQQKKYNCYLNFFSCFVLYFPQFNRYVGLGLEQLMTASITILLFLFLLYKNASISKNAIFCALIYLIILLVDLLRSFNIVIMNDYFELIKPISFLIFFSFGYIIKKIVDVEDYSRWLMGNFILISLIGILEATINSVDNFLSIIYKSPRTALMGKAVFSFISPYCLAAVLIIPLFYYFFNYFSSKKIKYLLCVLLCALCMLLTQSKTIFLGVIIVSFILMLIILFNKWIPGKRKILITFFATLVCVIILLPVLLAIASKRFSYLYSGLKVFFKSFSKFNIISVLNAQPNTRLRLEQFLFAIEHQDFIPLIGVGIGKAVLMPESFYAMYLYRTGLIGVSIHGFMVYYACKRTFILAKHYACAKNYNLFSFYFSLFVFFLSLPFSYFSSAITDQTRIAFFFYLFIGHLYSIKIRNFKYIPKLLDN